MLSAFFDPGCWWQKIQRHPLLIIRGDPRKCTPVGALVHGENRPHEFPLIAADVEIVLNCIDFTECVTQTTLVRADSQSGLARPHVTLYSYRVSARLKVITLFSLQ